MTGKEMLSQIVSGDITELVNDNVDTITLRAALYELPNLSRVELPNLISIEGGYNFYICPIIENITLPSLTSMTSMEGCCFSFNDALKRLDIPEITELKTYSVYNNPNLEIVNCPKLVSIGYNVFGVCPKLNLETLPLDNLTDIVNIMEIFPRNVWRWKSVKTVGKLDNSSFTGLIGPTVKIVDFHALEYIYGRWINWTNYELQVMVIRSPKKSTLDWYSSTYFPKTDFKIYVHQNLVEEYENDEATGWGFFKNKIFPLEGSPFEDPDWREEDIDWL